MNLLRLFTIGIWICAIASNALAQVNIEQIKNDPNYKWGEGTGVTYEEADEDALATLSRSIWTVITNGSTQKGSSHIVNGEVSSENKQEIFTKSFTMTTIPNAKLVEISSEPDCRIFRYVHIDDIRTMQEQKNRHITDYIETGKNTEKRLQIDDALRCYYWALILAKANMEPVYVDFDGKPTDSRSYLPLKIKSVIANIKAELTDCRNENGHYIARLRFTYNGVDVSSLQVWYNDGQSFRGPITVRDGVGELELLSLPVQKKIPIRYEYRFKEEASNLDTELEAAFACISPLIINANTEVPVKVDEKKGIIESRGSATANTLADHKETAIAPEPIRTKIRMQLKEATDKDKYLQALADIEKAISQGDPALAKEHFDPNYEGYKMFETLLTKTGKVTLSGRQNYEFIQGNDLVLGRFCRIKIQFRNGKSFMENIVFRFLPSNEKIESIAMALSKKAEDDIFNAALKWPEVSKFTIQRFMEDYQTAYSLKRLDYIEKIFSDNALIITGSVLAPTKGTYDEMEFNFDRGSKNVRYTKQNKSQYLARLKRHFREREYIHLTFEDNRTGLINTQGVLDTGSAFGIQIKQIYTSPVYSDRGYLSLFLNMQGKSPIIEVRFWQPESDEMISFSDFQKAFQVK